MSSRWRLPWQFRRLLRWCASLFAGSRRRSLLIGLAVSPAIVVALSILLLATILISPADRAATWYQQQAASALAKRDFHTARLCYASVLQQRPASQECQLGLAISLAGLGEHSAARILLEQLTQPGGSDYPPAHVYYAEGLLNQPSPSPADLASAEAHLQQVLKRQPKDVRAHALLAWLYARAGKWDLFKEHLPMAGSASILDEAALPAAEALRARGDWAEVNALARRAVALYSERVKATPTDAESWMRLAQATLLLKDYEQTVKVLQSGWEQTKNPSFLQATAGVIALWLRASPGMEAPRRLALIEEGLICDLKNGLLLLVVLDPATAEAADVVQPTTAPVRGAAVRALCQAVAAARANQPQRLRRELETAIAVGGERMVGIAANVCTVWAYSKEADSPSSLLLSTDLLALRPTDAGVQRAQGLVLSTQGRWGQAVDCLEAVLPRMPEDRGVHAALAEAYEKLGKPEKAAEHRRLAQPTSAPTTAATTLPATGTAAK